MNPHATAILIVSTVTLKVDWLNSLMHSVNRLGPDDSDVNLHCQMNESVDVSTCHGNVNCVNRDLESGLSLIC